uniref:SH3 domain and tetratricopeptide repeat-containing protein 1-like n=1 Tax=Sinocyclocheilus anshuiensis TaxID=1608454 RepID=A0A671LYX7_9TELE
MQLAMVEGPDRLPADEGTQEVLCRKLCVLEADLSGVVTLISELSAHFVSINSEERTIFITFKTLEEIWKFSTYHKMGFLGQCMENLLMNQEFWLISLDQHSGIEISIKEETLNLMYKGFLMQEGKYIVLLGSPRMHLFDPKYSKNCNNVKYYLTVFYLNIF